MARKGFCDDNRDGGVRVSRGLRSHAGRGCGFGRVMGVEPSAWSRMLPLVSLCSRPPPRMLPTLPVPRSAPALQPPVASSYVATGQQRPLTALSLAGL